MQPLEKVKKRSKKTLHLGESDNLVDEVDKLHRRWHNSTPIKDIVNGTYGSDPNVTGVFWLEKTIMKRDSVFVVKFVLFWWTKFISYYKENQKQPGIKESSIKEKFQPSRCRQDRKDQNSPVLWLNFRDEVLAEYGLCVPSNFGYESIKTYLPWWTDYGETPSEKYLKYPKNNGSKKGKRLKKKTHAEKRKRNEREDVENSKRQKQDAPPSQTNMVINIPFNIPPPITITTPNYTWYRPTLTMSPYTVPEILKPEPPDMWWDQYQNPSILFFDDLSSESTEERDHGPRFDDLWDEVIQFWNLYKPPLFQDTTEIHQ